MRMLTPREPEVVTKLPLPSRRRCPNVRSLLFYVAHPLTDFNNSEAVEMLDSLQTTVKDKAHEKQDYYRLAYHTARDKIHLSQETSRVVIPRSRFTGLADEKAYEITCDTLY